MSSLRSFLAARAVPLMFVFGGAVCLGVAVGLWWRDTFRPEMAAHIEARSIRFKSATRQPQDLIVNVRLAELTIETGHADITGGAVRRLGPTGTPAEVDTPLPTRLKAGAITLHDVRLERLTLSGRNSNRSAALDQSSGVIKLQTVDGSPAVQVAVSGPSAAAGWAHGDAPAINFTCAPCEVEGDTLEGEFVVLGETPSLTFESTAFALMVDTTQTSSSNESILTAPPGLRVAALSFRGDTAVEVPVTVSAIVRGELTFPNLSDSPIPLDRSRHVEFSPSDTVAVRELTVTVVPGAQAPAALIRATLAGRVSRPRVGVGPMLTARPMVHEFFQTSYLGIALSILGGVSTIAGLTSIGELFTWCRKWLAKAR